MSLTPIRLTGTGVQTSPLGFGCVRLTTCASESAALATLSCALEHGVIHFDTARAYGSGHSERILGRFLAGKRDKVVVATKLGLIPNQGLARNRLVYATAKRIFKLFPGLRKRALKPAGAPAPARAAPFDVALARESFETSLKTLGTDYVDLLMLHEALMVDLQSEPLLQFMDAQVKRGAARAVGIATRFSSFNGDASIVPPPFQVLQFDHSVAKPNAQRLMNADGRSLILYSVLEPLSFLRKAAEQQPNVTADFAQRLDVDLASSTTLGQLLICSALRVNPTGVTLFSSQTPEHIIANAGLVNRRPFSDEQLDGFFDYVLAIYAQPAQSA